MSTRLSLMLEDKEIPIDEFQFTDTSIPLPSLPMKKDHTTAEKIDTDEIEKAHYITVFLDESTTVYIPSDPRKGDKGFLEMDDGIFFEYVIKSIDSLNEQKKDKLSEDNSEFTLHIGSPGLTMDISGEKTIQLQKIPKVQVIKDLRRYTVLPAGCGLYSLYPWLSGSKSKDAIMVGSREELEHHFFSHITTPEDAGIRIYLGEKGLELQVGRVVRLLPYHGRDPLALKETFLTLLEHELPSIIDKANDCPHIFVADNTIDKIFDNAVKLTCGLPSYRIVASGEPDLSAILYQKLRKEPELFSNVHIDDKKSVMLRPGPKLLTFSTLDDITGDLIMKKIRETLKENGNESSHIRCAVRYLSQGFGGYSEINHEGKIIDSWKFVMNQSPKCQFRDYEQRIMDKVFFDDKNFQDTFQECLPQLQDIMNDNNDSIFIINNSIANKYADMLANSLTRKGNELRGKKVTTADEAYAKHYASIVHTSVDKPKDSVEHINREHSRTLSITESMLSEGYNELVVKKAILKNSIYVKCYTKPNLVGDYCSSVVHDAKNHIQKLSSMFR